MKYIKLPFLIVGFVFVTSSQPSRLRSSLSTMRSVEYQGRIGEMRKFSWYTIIHPDWNKGEPPLFRLVGPAILPDERTCDIYFKPNRKGGHTHNHLKNIELRLMLSKKEIKALRKIMKRETKNG